MKTYKSLMKGMIKELTQFLKFKECGILFYDSVKEKLFAISTDEE